MSKVNRSRGTDDLWAGKRGAKGRGRRPRRARRSSCCPSCLKTGISARKKSYEKLPSGDNAGVKTPR